MHLNVTEALWFTFVWKEQMVNNETFYFGLNLPLCVGQTLQWASSMDVHIPQTSGQAVDRRGHCRFSCGVQLNSGDIRRKK